MTTDIANGLRNLNSLVASTLAVEGQTVQGVVTAVQPSVTALQTQMASIQVSDQRYLWQLVTLTAEFLSFLQVGFPGH
jgi:hypothetical protein